jgi:hypothetical protein
MRAVRGVVRCFPPAWRERYGNEFGALLEDLQAEDRLGLLALSDVLWAALKSQLRLRRWRRPVAALSIALAISGVALGFGLSLGSGLGGATAAAGPGPAGFAAPLGSRQDSDASTDMAEEGLNGVVVHLVVDADGATSGTTIVGHLQVINNTRHALRGGAACRADVLAPVIYGGAFRERPVFVHRSCAPSFSFPTGVTTLPFSLSASFDSPSGSQPLPTGYYRVGVVVHGPHIPVPSPLTVIVLPPTPGKQRGGAQDPSGP